MTRTNIAALALLAGVAIAAPTLVCSAADSETQTAQAQTPSSPGALRCLEVPATVST